MLLKENILLALAGLKANKMRSFLTMLGIIIGIASVIAIMTVGDAVNNSVTSSMGDIGANNIELYLGYRDDLDFNQDLPAMEGKDCISTDMIEEMLKKYSDEIKAVSLQVSVGDGKATEGKDYANVSIIGANTGFLLDKKLNIVAGRNLAKKDQENGKKVAVMSAVGDDVIGHYLSQVLVENNIDVSSLVFTPNYSTFLAFVDIDETGNRTFYSLSNGVNDASLRGFTLNDVDKQMLLETRIFHTSGCTFVYDTTRAVTQYAMQVVKEAGGMISFDLNWRPFLFDKKFAEEFIIPYLCKIDILKLSDSDLEFLVGSTDIKDGCQKLHQLGVRFVAVTLGPNGSYYSYSGGAAFQDTYDTTVIDTTGSGDTFMAAILAGILSTEKDIDEIPNEQMYDIVDFANAAGALCATQTGSMMSMPYENEINECRKTVQKLKGKRM